MTTHPQQLMNVKHEDHTLNHVSINILLRIIFRLVFQIIHINLVSNSKTMISKLAFNEKKIKQIEILGYAYKIQAQLLTYAPKLTIYYRSSF